MKFVEECADRSVFNYSQKWGRFGLIPYWATLIAHAVRGRRNQTHS
jgi:hypothetical protein